MTETKILSQPFEFFSTPPMDFWVVQGVIAIVIAVTAGIAGFLHFQGYFQLPAEFSTIPIEMLCGGITLFFLFLDLLGSFGLMDIVLILQSKQFKRLKKDSLVLAKAK